MKCFAASLDWGGEIWKSWRRMGSSKVENL
jgi:hypothetical protein